MKATILNISVVIISLCILFGCTNEDEGNVTKAPMDNGMVEIKLGSDLDLQVNVSSRGVIKPTDEDHNFHLSNIGVFMLADFQQKSIDEGFDINWNHTGQSINTWLVNIPAVAETNLSGTTDIKMKSSLNSDTTVYYPQENIYAYRFYSYYPRVANNKIGITSTKRTVTYRLDGSTDVLWAATEAVDSVNASEVDKRKYSASYVRLMSSESDKPNLTFHHCLMAFQFWIMGSDNHGDYTMANKMALDTVIIKRVPTKGTLTIADHTRESEGTMNIDWNDEESFADIGIKGTDDGPLGNIENRRINGSTQIRVGESVLLPVIDNYADRSHYTAYVKLRKLDDNQVYETTIPVVMQESLMSDFRSGICYHVVLRIAGPQTVTLQASIEDWEDIVIDKTPGVYVEDGIGLDIQYGGVDDGSHEPKSRFNTDLLYKR